MSTNFAAFIAILQTIFDSGFTALGFTEAQIFRLANCKAQPHHRVPYSAYRDFVENHGSDDFQVYPDPMLNALQQIYVVIETNTLSQQQMMIQEITEDKPNWRRLTWLVSKRQTEERMALRKTEKKERAERAAAKMAQAFAAPQKTTNVPAEAPKAPAPAQPAPAAVAVAAPAPVAPATVVAAPAPTTPATAKTAAEPTAMPLTKEALLAKWHNRFRPDWPWNISPGTSILLSVKQLREIEEEIAAERAAGAPDLYPDRPYATSSPRLTDGFVRMERAKGNYPLVTRHYDLADKNIEEVKYHMEMRQPVSWLPMLW